MKQVLSWFILLILSDTVAAAIGARILFRMHGIFPRAVGILMTAFVLEQIASIVAITFDYRNIKHTTTFLIIIVLFRGLRSLAMWGLVWFLTLPRDE